MAQVAFDTLKFVTKLKEAGLTERAAVIFSEAQNEILVEAMNNNLATKHDIYEFRHATQADIREAREETQVEFQKVRQEVHDLRQETQSEFRAVREETQSEFRAVREEMQSEFRAVREEMQDFKQETQIGFREAHEDRQALRHEMQQMEYRFDIKREKSIAPLAANIRVLNWMMGFVLAGIGALILKTFFGGI